MLLFFVWVFEWQHKILILKMYTWFQVKLNARLNFMNYMKVFKWLFRKELGFLYAIRYEIIRFLIFMNIR